MKPALSLGCPVLILARGVIRSHRVGYLTRQLHRLCFNHVVQAFQPAFLRLQTCPVLRQALNLGFPKGTGFPNR
jgi:hypothetical protein